MKINPITYLIILYVSSKLKIPKAANIVPNIPNGEMFSFSNVVKMREVRFEGSIPLPCILPEISSHAITNLDWFLKISGLVCVCVWVGGWDIPAN